MHMFFCQKNAKNLCAVCAQLSQSAKTCVA